MKTWYDIPQPQTTWLVDGLIPIDGYATLCGKPKAGKSTAIRNLIACVIKGRKFLGRSIDIEPGTGRVLYLHLDRKDQPWRVAKELRDLGITEKESSRLVLMTAQDIPKTFGDRLKWLTREILKAQPHLIVIDLLWQFVVADNSNDYNAVLDGINTLQDTLSAVKYRGALVVALHGRKATNPNDPADDILGSTGQRGSFSTNIFLTRYRKENVYTILTEQTERDEIYGEIDETVITRNLDGTLSLGQTFAQIAKEQKQVKDQSELLRLFNHIKTNPGCEMKSGDADIIHSLNFTETTVQKLLSLAGDLIYKTGEGVKGDPFKYFVNEQPTPQGAATRFTASFGV